MPSLTAKSPVKACLVGDGRVELLLELSILHSRGSRGVQGFLMKNTRIYVYTCSCWIRQTKIEAIKGFREACDEAFAILMHE